MWFQWDDIAICAKLWDDKERQNFYFSGSVWKVRLLLI